MNKEDFELEMCTEECCSPEDVDITPRFNIRTFWGKDETPIIEIDTPELDEDDRGIIVRIYLNDHCVYENPPFRN